MFAHVLPNVLGPVLVIGTLQIGAAIITESTLSFLGRRRTAHPTVAGHADPHRQRLPVLGRMVDHGLPGGRPRHPGAVDQRAGRLAARRPQPPTTLKEIPMKRMLLASLFALAVRLRGPLRPTLRDHHGRHRQVVRSQPAQGDREPRRRGNDHDRQQGRGRARAAQGHPRPAAAQGFQPGDPEHPSSSTPRRARAITSRPSSPRRPRRSGRRSIRREEAIGECHKKFKIADERSDARSSRSATSASSSTPGAERWSPSTT